MDEEVRVGAPAPTTVTLICTTNSNDLHHQLQKTIRNATGIVGTILHRLSFIEDLICTAQKWIRSGFRSGGFFNSDVVAVAHMTPQTLTRS